MISPDRIFLFAGALNGFLAVAAGAFGAHALKARLVPDLLAVFETAARYQLMHGLALMAAGLVWARWPVAAAHAAGWLLLAGVLLFSGSLYALALSGVRAWGAVAPVGGLALLVGWLCIAWTVVRASPSRRC